MKLNQCAYLFLISITRVPAYSPYAVAEFAVGLMLTLNRKYHKAYQRVKDFNFSLNGLVGFDMRGKTVGVFGTGEQTILIFLTYFQARLGIALSKSFLDLDVRFWQWICTKMKN